MKTHELKTWPIFFKSIIDGTKTFEVRQNDRNFQFGDILLLREYDPDAEQYTGAKTERKVTYILGDNPFFQLNNMVILGIQPVEPQEPTIKDKIKAHISDEEAVVSRWIREDAEKQTAEEILDLQQYVTNLLYAAYNEGVKLHIPYNTTKFDKWVEEQTELLKEYVQNQQPKEIKEELVKLLNWIDKSTYWKEDNDIPTEFIVDEYLKSTDLDRQRDDYYNRDKLFEKKK